jgi:hypothetical protein
MSNSKALINFVLGGQCSGPRPDVLHARTILEAIGLTPERANFLWLRDQMTRIDWEPAGNIRIDGRQGQAYRRVEL